MRVPSISITLKRVPSCDTSSPGSGARPSSRTNPAIVVVVDRELPLELLVEVVDRERAGDAYPPVGQLLDRLVG